MRRLRDPALCLLSWALLLAACAPAPGGGSRPDAGDASDGGGGPAGEPIVAPAETWTWAEIDGAVCGNGIVTGVGVNLTDRSDEVLVYLVGGGACWDVNTCFVLRSAVNIESGYGETRFANEGLLAATAFDRTNPDNPFRDMSFVFVPYCTGDLHAGNRVGTYSALGQTREVHHVGAANMEVILPRLVATFPDAPRIFISGSSAGGYGVQLNYGRFAEAFAGVEVHLLADSAQMVQPWGGRYGEMRVAWDLPAPPGCDGCREEFPRWLDHWLATYPGRRFGLLAFDADQTLSIYLNYPLDGTFTNRTNALLAERYDPDPDAHYYVLAGTNHVLLGALTTAVHPDGTALIDWVRDWTTGAAGWDDAR